MTTVTLWLTCRTGSIIRICESNLININYNCVEVFQKEDDDWHVIHSTWSVIRPMEMDFSAMKEIV